MVLAVEPKALTPLVPYGKAVQKRAPIQPVPPIGEQQQGARAFLETLPTDVRERLENDQRPQRRQVNPDDVRDNQQAERSSTEPTPVAQAPLSARPRPSGPGFVAAQSIAPQAIFAQISLSEEDATSRPISESVLAGGNQAYVNAGAQIGGPEGLRAYQESRQTPQNVLIVPPVPTSYNLQA